MKIGANSVMLIHEFIKQDDKQKHIYICFLLAIATLPYLGVWFSALLTLSIGLSKECWDKYYGSGFCWYDMLANAAGWLLAILAYWLYMWVALL